MVLLICFLLSIFIMAIDVFMLWMECGQQHHKSDCPPVPGTGEASPPVFRRAGANPEKGNRAEKG